LSVILPELLWALRPDNAELFARFDGPPEGDEDAKVVRLLRIGGEWVHCSKPGIGAGWAAWTTSVRSAESLEELLADFSVWVEYFALYYVDAARVPDWQALAERYASRVSRTDLVEPFRNVSELQELRTSPENGLK
jgi:hypothetical protein